MKWMLLISLLCFGCRTVQRPAAPPSPVTTFISHAQPEAVVIAPPGVTLVTDVDLEWNPVEGAASYNVYYGTFPHSYSAMQSAGTNLTIDVPDLEPYMTYYFAATALDELEIESDFSDELAVTIPYRLDLWPTFDQPVINVSIECSPDLMQWLPAVATLKPSGAWRIRIDPTSSSRFYRGVGQSVPAL